MGLNQPNFSWTTSVNESPLSQTSAMRAKHVLCELYLEKNCYGAFSHRFSKWCAQSRAEKRTGPVSVDCSSQYPAQQEKEQHASAL
jgi:hypothetical protein